MGQKNWNSTDQVQLLLGIWDDQTYIYKDGVSYKYTTDGGATEQNITPSLSITEQMGSVYYLNSNELFATVRRSSGSAHCWVSTDGGASFTKKGSLVPGPGYTVSAINEVYFFDSQKGLVMLRALKNNVVDVTMRTTDGGATWSPATSDTLAFDDEEDVIFHPNGTVRVFIGSSMMESKDYGATWTIAGTNVLTTSGELADDGGQNIWGVGSAGANKPCYVFSTDGGASYATWNIPDENNGGVKACDANQIERLAPGHILIEGDRSGPQDPVTILSEDDGTTWQDVKFPSGFSAGALIIGKTDDGSAFYCWDAASQQLFTLKTGGGVSLKEQQRGIFKVYPNPVAESFNIFLSEHPETGTEIRISDHTGRLVRSYQANSSELRISSEILPARGIYLISIHDASGQLMAQEKIIRP